MYITDNLRSQNNSLWERTVEHPFVRELGDGTLPVEKFRRYFIQDYLFVKELARVLALGIAKAPNFEAGKKLAEFLQVLLTSEDSLFQRAFREVGVHQEEYTQARAMPTTMAFSNFLVRLGNDGAFEDILMALYVTEGTYLDWASRLIQQGKRPQVRMYQEWIEIHSPDALGGFVGWAKGWLDANTSERELHLAEVFLTTLRYECMFWEMAYRGEKWPDE